MSVDQPGRLSGRLDTIHLSPGRITAIYVAFGFLLLAVSDVLLPQFITDPALLRSVQGVKGAVEVLLTGGLIFVLVARRERELEQTERTYRNLLENSPAPINLFDADGGTVWGNDAVVDLLGLEDRGDLVGRSIFDFIHPDDQGVAEGELEAVIEGDADVGPTDFRLVRGDGDVRQVRVNTTGGWFDGERVGQALVVDLTELRAVEAELRAERDFIRHALDDLRDVFFVLDPDGGFVRWNERLVEATGYDEGELERIEPLDLVADEDEAAIEQAIEEALETGQSFVEADLLGKDGTRRAYEVKAARFDGGEGRPRLVGIGRDVTERRRLERERRENERRYRTLVEMSPDAVVVHRDGEIRFANDAAVDLLAADGREQLVGTDITRYVPAGTAADVEMRAASIQRGEAPSASREWPLLDLDGTERRVESIARPIAYEGDPAVLTVLRDVTDRHRYEQRLTELHDRTRAMTLAEDQDAIATVGVQSLEDLLDLDGAAFYALGEDDTLAPAARSSGLDDRLGDEPLERTRQGPIWDAFVDGDERVLDLPDDDLLPVLGPGTALVLPVGDHGLLVAAASEERSLATAQREVARLLGENLAAALDRAEREATLQRRDRQLARQNAALEQLNRLNEVIRGINQTLVRSTTAGEIKASVCERLAGAPRYAFAWMATRDPVDGQPRPSHWDQADPEYVDFLESTDERTALHDLVDAAFREHALQAAVDVRGEPAWEANRRDALQYGYRSVAAVPVTVGDRVESVLVVHAEPAGVFDEEERAVLAELGETVGYALRNVERHEAVRSDDRTEVELRVDDDRLFTNRLSAVTGAAIEFVGVVGADADADRLYLRIAGAPEETVLEAAEALESVRAAETLSIEDSDGLYQLTVASPALFRVLRSRAAWLRALATDDGSTTLTVVLTGEARVRTLVEELQGAYPGTELLVRREQAEPIETRETFRDRLLEELTEKQHRALQTAQYGGYYEWPRVSSSERLAESMDIASSTFQYHLRAAERKVVGQVLG